MSRLFLNEKTSHMRKGEIHRDMSIGGYGYRILCSTGLQSLLSLSFTYNKTKARWAAASLGEEEESNRGSQHFHLRSHCSLLRLKERTSSCRRLRWGRLFNTSPGPPGWPRQHQQHQPENEVNNTKTTFCQQLCCYLTPTLLSLFLQNQNLSLKINVRITRLMRSHACGDLSRPVSAPGCPHDSH